MTFYQWVTLGLGALGFVGTWIILAFTLGRAVEQMKAEFKVEIGTERDKIFAKIEAVESRFEADLEHQNRHFGEVGLSMRQYTADVEKKLREVEIYGRDNYVKIPDFEKAIDRMGETINNAVAEIKKDMRQLLKPSAD
jgi:hypothetical protein